MGCACKPHSEVVACKIYQEISVPITCGNLNESATRGGGEREEQEEVKEGEDGEMPLVRANIAYQSVVVDGGGDDRANLSKISRYLDSD